MKTLQICCIKILTKSIRNRHIWLKKIGKTKKNPQLCIRNMYSKLKKRNETIGQFELKRQQGCQWFSFPFGIFPFYCR